MAQKPSLVSFKLCPYVQRSVITLEYKGVDYDIRYIDLGDPPDWFLDVSPLGKVPLLMVADQVIFESAVINEYLDEVNPPSLHPTDPVQRAVHRAWIEYASELIGAQFNMLTADQEAHFEERAKKMRHLLKRLESVLGDGPFFSGESFALIDAAYAPLFTRMDLFQTRREAGLMKDLPKLRQWAQNLEALPAVRNSVVDDFEPRFFSFFAERSQYLAQFFAPAAP